MLNHQTRKVSIDDLRDYMERLLAAIGLDAETARAVAGVHLESDLRGVSVQGFNHLVNSHLQYYMEGHADPRGKPEVMKDGPCWALIDGHSGPGPIAGLLAAEVAIDKARQAGCAVVGVTNSHDMFQAGLYAERIARAGLVAMVYSDDVVPVVHAPGGTEPNIGSNPMAWAAPTEGAPFLLDFSPCATLPTYVRYTERYGGTLDAGLAHDKDGNPTTDPAEVCRGKTHQRDVGAIDPGGHRGFGMLLMIDFLSGALVGADMGMAHVDKEHPRKGHLLIAIDPGIFGDGATFKRAVGARIADIKASSRAPGVTEIRIPGEGSHARRTAALAAGTVEIDIHCWGDGLEIGRRLGVAPPA